MKRQELKMGYSINGLSGALGEEGWHPCLLISL